MQEERQQTEVRESKTQVGDTMVDKQVVSQKTQTSGAVIAQRIVWFIVGAIATIIALRFVLLLLGANEGAGFTSFVYGLSSVFVAPFAGIFTQPVYGTAVFDFSSLLAIVIYLLIGLGIAKLLTLGRPRDEV